MKRIGRIAVVTMGLIAAGMVFGAIAGGVAFTIVGVIAGEGVSTEAFGIGAMFGFPLGAVTAPLLSWLLLRHVPVGTMFVACSSGTIVGGIIGWYATSAGGDIMINPLVGAFAGCLVAATFLWNRTRMHAGKTR